jgi:hypothetical protein
MRFDDVAECGHSACSTGSVSAVATPRGITGAKPERLFPETASDVTLKVGYERLGFRTNACRYTDWASSRRWNSS